MRLPGIPEEVDPVTEFETLKTGMLVICDHGWCGRKHRHLLLNRTESESGEPGFFVTPPVPCRSGFDAIGKRAVDRRTVYRVVDPALASTKTTATRTREPVRT